jgi:hypothetical protein
MFDESDAVNTKRPPFIRAASLLSVRFAVLNLLWMAKHRLNLEE